jgi:hypothetical protein
LYGIKENVIIGKSSCRNWLRGDIRGSDGPIEEYEGVVIEKELPKERVERRDEEPELPAQRHPATSQNLSRASGAHLPVTQFSRGDVKSPLFATPPFLLRMLYNR